MISRLACLCLIAATFATAGAFAQTASRIKPAPPVDEPVNGLKLPDADLATVLELLERLTDRTVLRPAALQTATYNLVINKPITKAEAILAVETVLALNGIGLSPLDDKFLKVVNLQQVGKEAPEMIQGSALGLPASGRVATKLFQLEFARVQDITPLLGSVLNGLYGGPVLLQNANAMFVTDSISNLQRLELILQDVDKPVVSGMKPKFYSVRNVKASELVNKLRGILTGTLQQQLGTATTYSADDRTQQIVVVTDPRQWEFFTELIEKLDQKSDPNTRTEVLYLKNAKAKDVVDVLSRIISGTTSALQRQNTGSVRPGPTPAPGMAPGAPAQPTVVSATSANNPNVDGAASTEFSALMTVVNDERSNAVVVFGTSDDIRLTRDLVDKLDIQLAQVRIEVVIADVTLDDNHESGISSLGLKVEGNKLVGFSGSEASVTVSNGTITRPGLDLAAEISIKTTPRKRNNAIITQPSTVTSHGKEAKFFTGETRPVVTGTINSAAGATTGLASSSTVTQQQIGTTLTATPFIGVNNSVQLEITQSVEDVTGTVKVDANDQYIIGKRESKSYVSAMSGDILVFSGFRKNTMVNETNRLGPIPIIGDLFGSRKKSANRSELIFFIRATVITNNPVIDNAETMKRIEQLPARDAIKGALDSNYTPSK
ncbi:MAG: type II secretory pathway, component PulD [Opitutaceae bacterium]|nr:type II secretory pathway, component PulD [Opitutaceae bacterium]